MPHRMTTFRFADSVDPNTTEEYEETLHAAATIEGIEVRIYPGPELDLRVKLFAVDGADRRPLINFNGKEYVDGDNDVWSFDVSEPIDEGEEILVEVENQDANTTYNFAVNMAVDFAGGIERLVKRVISHG